MQNDGKKATEPEIGSEAGKWASSMFPRLKSLGAWFGRTFYFVFRLGGALLWGAYLLFFIVPPVILLLLLSVGGFPLLADLSDQDFVTVLLTATGTTAALAGLCFSYSRAVEQRTSKHAGLTSGRMLLGATVALAVAMAAHYFDTLSAFSAQTESNAFRRLLVDNSLEVTLRVTPVLVCLAVLRMYLHLLRLAGIAYVHTYDSLEGRAAREELRLFD